MFFQVRNAAEFSRHTPSPAHAAPYTLWSPQTAAGAGRHLELLPSSLGTPLWPQPTAAVGTRGSGARNFYIITHRPPSQNQLSRHRHLMPDSTNTSSSLSPQAGLPAALTPYLCHTNKPNSSAVLGPTYAAQLASLWVKFCNLPKQGGHSACNGQVQGWVNPQTPGKCELSWAETVLGIVVIF